MDLVQIHHLIIKLKYYLDYQKKQIIQKDQIMVKLNI